MQERDFRILLQVTADLAVYADSKFNNTQLAVQLLAEFVRNSPAEYDADSDKNGPAVKQAAEMLTLLAERLPKVVSNHISLLAPYFSCQAAQNVRSALVSVIGASGGFSNSMMRQAPRCSALCWCAAWTGFPCLWIFRI